MIYGWDISTAVVGLVVMHDSGLVSFVTHLDLRKVKDDTQKLIKFKEFVIANVFEPKDVETSYNFVEDRLAGFTRGFTNAGTLMKLGAFNHTCCWIIRECFVQAEIPFDIKKMHPTTVKSKVGLKVPKGKNKKEAALTLVKDILYPDFPIILNRKGKVDVRTYDMVDAYIVAEAGRRKFVTKP